MLPRILEPEVMESAEEALEYDAMEHGAVNRAFVDDFLRALNALGFAERFHDVSPPFNILDCGTGTALIPILLAHHPLVTRIVATDLSEEMLKVARRNVERAGLSACITLRREDGKVMSFSDGTFDAVISNSLIHHIPVPRGAFAEMVRVLRPGGLLFVRDQLRPVSLAQLDTLVEQHTIGSTDHQRSLFRDSLHAALTIKEVETILNGLPLENRRVERTSDRHWTVTAVLG